MISEKKLFFRLIILLIAMFCFVAALTLFVQSKLHSDIMKSERELVFNTIEDSALHFARSYSSEFGSKIIEKTFSSPEIIKRGFIGASIYSGKNFNEKIISYTKNHEDKCINTYEKVIQNKTDLHPFKIILYKDSCNLMIKPIVLAGATSYILIFILSSLAIYYSYRPLIQSTKHAIDIIRHNKPYSESKKIVFEPINTLYTESIKAKELTKENEKIKLAQQVAHDIRSPITALDIVAQNSPEMDIKKQELLQNAIKRIKSIANDLLDKKKETKGQFDLYKEINDIYKELKLEFNNKKFSLEFNTILENQKPVLDLPNDKLQRVLLNVLKNSIESLYDNGLLRIELNFNSNGIELKISDNGKGMDSKTLSNIGKRGFTVGKKQGSGLGVNYSMSVIQEMGGTLTYSSKPRKGTTVTICLPKKYIL